MDDPVSKGASGVLWGPLGPEALSMASCPLPDSLHEPPKPLWSSFSLSIFNDPPTDPSSEFSWLVSEVKRRSLERLILFPATFNESFCSLPLGFASLLASSTTISLLPDVSVPLSDVLDEAPGSSPEPTCAFNSPPGFLFPLLEHPESPLVHSIFPLLFPEAFGSILGASNLFLWFDLSVWVFCISTSFCKDGGVFGAGGVSSWLSFGCSEGSECNYDCCGSGCDGDGDGTGLGFTGFGFFEAFGRGLGSFS